MDIEEIRQGFLQAYQNLNEIRCSLPPDAPRKYSYKIFPMLCLNELSKAIQKSAYHEKSYDQSNDDFIQNYGARFIVDMGSEIKFALEGPRSSSIPAHTDLASRVLSAGNIYFSEDYSKIVGISNKSGHFLPAFSTLVFAIPLILESGFPLSESIELKNEATGASIMLSKAEMMELIPLDLKDNLAQLLEINSSCEVFVDQSFNHELREDAKSHFITQASFGFFDFDEGYETPDDAPQAKRIRSEQFVKF